MERRHLEVLNCGGGRQSTALVAMACEGIIAAPDVVIMADTGWERQQTIDYWHRYLVPAMRDAGIPFEIVRRVHTHETQRGRVGNIRADILASVRDGTRIANPPLWTLKADGTRGKLQRCCTAEYKIDPITKRVREMLGLRPGQHWETTKRRCTARQWIGIAAEEAKRANGNSGNDSIELVYPLVEMGMTTTDCVDMLRDLGFPVPVKSACIGCPFRSLQSWARMRRDDPEAFADAVDFDERLRWPHGMGRLNDGMTERDYLLGNVPSRVKGAQHPAYLLPQCVPLGEIELPEVDDEAAESFGGEC